MKLMRILFALILIIPSIGVAQNNLTQLGYLNLPDTHNVILNDAWGYVDELGNEYAILGSTGGVSIVDVTNPANPIEIDWIPSALSSWRDIKTSGDFAYVTTEADTGLMIIDLSPLPAGTNLVETYYTGPVGNEWYSAHNLYEENGYLYIFGADRGNAGVIILDVFTDPLNPVEVGTIDSLYVHDGFVRNDTVYLANIGEGIFTIYDATNKSAPVFLGSFATPSNFTHNIWASADGNYAFTTDEVSGGYIASYDVSDPSNIQYLDQVQRLPGSGRYPHNTHILGDYLVTSYYTEGVVIHDATYPDNLIEVANFDTSPLSNSGTGGCWGVYPFLPSGNIIAADRQEGLFVLGSTAHHAAYLEGVITEFGTSNTLGGVSISFDNQSITDYSLVNGSYATGTELTGTYDLSYFKILYYPQTIATTLLEGALTTQDVALVPIPQYPITITVLDVQTLNPIQGASVVAHHEYISHNGITDVNGEVVLNLYYEDVYEVIAGMWGYDSDCFDDTLLDSGTATLTLYIDQAIYDDFSFDFGWSVFGNAQKGLWEREVAVGVDIGGVIENPFTDGLFDCGREAYITGNGSTIGNDQEVENGQTTLISPVFDLSGFSNPYVNFEAFFYNMEGPQYPDDTLFISLYNGTSTVKIAKIYKDNTVMSQWLPYSIPISGLISLTSTMQMIVNISDYPATVNICEAAFDNFSVTDFSMLTLADPSEEFIEIFPNPFRDGIFIRGVQAGKVEVIDLSGRLIYISEVQEFIDLESIENGIYLIQIRDLNGNIVKVSKQIKK
jgi:choice-of-anchor B domain-containing protein